MKKDDNNEKKEKKLTLKEKLKDKRERAKIELIFYGIFFVAVIIFARLLESNTNNMVNNDMQDSFVFSITDNYEYDIIITKNDNVYEYFGKVLGNNSTINFKMDSMEKSYYLMNNKYYVLENDNYIFINEKEVYPYIDYRYLSVDNIKDYLKMSTKENNIYKVKLADIILNSDSVENIDIYIEEGDKNIIIDYTPLFKITDDSIDKLMVNITYSNINNILSLEE